MLPVEICTWPQHDTQNEKYEALLREPDLRPQDQVAILNTDSIPVCQWHSKHVGQYKPAVTQPSVLSETLMTGVAVEGVTVS